jgi:hypothetical protein
MRGRWNGSDGYVTFIAFGLYIRLSNLVHCVQPHRKADTRVELTVTTFGNPVAVPACHLAVP